MQLNRGGESHIKSTKVLFGKFEKELLEALLAWLERGTNSKINIISCHISRGSIPLMVPQNLPLRTFDSEHPKRY